MTAAAGKRTGQPTASPVNVERLYAGFVGRRRVGGFPKRTPAQRRGRVTVPSPLVHKLLAENFLYGSTVADRPGAVR